MVSLPLRRKLPMEAEFAGEAKTSAKPRADAVVKIVLLFIGFVPCWWIFIIFFEYLNVKLTENRRFLKFDKWFAAIWNRQRL